MEIVLLVKLDIHLYLIITKILLIYFVMINFVPHQTVIEMEPFVLFVMPRVRNAMEAQTNNA